MVKHLPESGIFYLDFSENILWSWFNLSLDILSISGFTGMTEVTTTLWLISTTDIAGKKIHIFTGVLKKERMLVWYSSSVIIQVRCGLICLKSRKESTEQVSEQKCSDSWWRNTNHFMLNLNVSRKKTKKNKYITSGERWDFIKHMTEQHLMISIQHLVMRL